MEEPGAATATAQVPSKEGGFPPFDTTTFPSQIFWLAITFAFLFVVLWRVAGPRIHNVIAARRGRINDDLAAAHSARKAAEEAASAYQAALGKARARASALAEETRKNLNGEIATAKAATDAEAASAMSKADARIAATRDQAKAHVLRAASDAAIAIVARLTGDQITAEEAAAAVRAVAGS